MGCSGEEGGDWSDELGDGSSPSLASSASSASKY